MGDGGITHGLKYQARALVAFPDSAQHSRWLAGTNALREENVVGTAALCNSVEHLLVLATS